MNAQFWVAGFIVGIASSQLITCWAHPLMPSSKYWELPAIQLVFGIGMTIAWTILAYRFDK